MKTVNNKSCKDEPSSAIFNFIIMVIIVVIVIIGTKGFGQNKSLGSINYETNNSLRVGVGYNYLTPYVRQEIGMLKGVSVESNLPIVAFFMRWC